MVQYTKQGLYGGAITVQIPQNLIDASQFRQVPDSQEVFLNTTENTTDYEELNKNDTIIFDLMEELEGSDDLEALKEHFSEISALNDAASNWKLVNVEQIEKNQYVGENDIKTYVGVGIEPALKWGRSEGATEEYTPTLVVVLGLIRLKRVETDALVTFNVLIENSKELDDLKQLHDAFAETGGENTAYLRVNLAVEAVKRVLGSFKVEDWNLFG